MKYLWVLLLVVGCRSAQRDLQKAERLIARAELNGAKIKADTTWNKIEFKSPEIKFETIIDDPRPYDSVFIVRDSIQLKIKKIIVAGKPRLEVSGKVPPMVITKRVPVIIERKIKAGHSLWEMIILAIVAFVVGLGLSPWILGYIRRRRTSQKPESPVV